MSFMKISAPSSEQSLQIAAGPATCFATDCVNISCFGGTVVLSFAEQIPVGPDQMALNNCARIALPMPCVEQLSRQLHDLIEAVKANRLPIMGNA